MATTTAATTNSSVQIGCGVDLLGHLPNVHLEALLHLLQYIGVLVRAHEGKREALGPKSACAANAVEV
eukprot:CAMPEP_0115216890 /NCGR_PEP_ID=MMETSP0270-20121206/25573_1 /TAXON_ID=71861 /ORGANISM="Scrippsiella trochoidea, Strain CCMP3099" /LENGTH=67 /DNA_ID=CAMNT_0002630745 /DNA_START=39 /DNA_END=242 /DNA_ORIENTATION=+